MNDYQSSIFDSQGLFRKRLIFVIFLLLTAHCSLLLLTTTTTTAHAETPSPRERRLEIFDEVWQTIEERYYDVNLRGVDWEAQREIYRSQAANAFNNAEFYQVLRLMVGSLHDSHTRVFAPEEKSDWRNPRFISVGVSVREIENELVFIKIDKNSAADRSGIKVGDILTSVDGVVAAKILARRMREQPGASTAAIGWLRAASGIFEGATDSVVSIGFQSARNDGKERFVSLRREWKTLPASVTARREGATLIISFDAFAPEIVRDLFQILGSQMRGVRGIVLDLRTNRGGSAEVMTDIASAFLPDNQVIGKFIDRTGRIEVEANTRRWLLYTASSVKVPTLPIVVLTSTATASAAEIFTAALKTAHRARIIGTQTCGCVLAVKGQHNLPDGGVLEISELDFQMPDGARLEGVGVAVDERIPQTRRDLLTRRDHPLERALKILKD